MKNKLSIKGQIELAKEMVMYNGGNRWHQYQRVASPVMNAVKNAEIAGDNGCEGFAPVIMTHSERRRCQRPLRQKMPAVTVRVRIHDRKNRFVFSGREN